MTTLINNILKKLETLSLRALNGHQWHAALQAAVRQGKNIGMFRKQCPPEVTRIADMTEQQRHEFMGALEKLDPELKNLGEESVEDLLKKESGWNNSHPELKHPPPPLKPIY